MICGAHVPLFPSFPPSLLPSKTKSHLGSHLCLTLCFFVLLFRCPNPSSCTSAALTEDIKLKQKKTVLVEKKLDSVRRLYKPLASVGQRLFFLVRMLHAVSPFYSFSLDWYKHLVRQALGKDSPPTLPTAPQQQIQQQVRATCTLHCYTQVEQTISFVANALLTMIYCWTMIYFLTMIHLLFFDNSWHETKSFSDACKHCCSRPCPDPSSRATSGCFQC